MTTAQARQGMSWGSRLLLALALLLAGAAAATWALARYDRAAQVLGVQPPPPPPAVQRPQQAVALPPQPMDPAPVGSPEDQAKIAELEARLARIENVTARAQGSAIRADSLLVAFAARRAIERGVALGYLEPLLVNRFGQQHPRAVATIVTASRAPVQLADLVREYEELGPVLRAPGPQESWWTGFKRELGSLIEIRHADRPSVKPDARYLRAAEQLRAGQVDQALAETMRLPGAPRAQRWIARARQYVAVRRALDEVESAALLTSPPIG